MEQTLAIIENSIIVVLFIFAVIFFWQIKSKKSMACKVIQLGLTTVLFVLQIPKLILEIFLSKSYVFEILMLCSWALIVAGYSFVIGKEMGEKNTTNSMKGHIV